ncbi:hypothetical protein L3N51_00907 [Metallosphaera sp. J1]|uniref:hypothetical protein n=1 Tax=Metallosphaera TaxID=41980 RepID=UPI001EE0D756|nr:hypothetical protein [Metallosphaera javensis (ex Hofmann et al. 2022)]MCG3108623.1 hypothetical protein [Metallosphaera javensis (ex Hofmann et al. 2022)]BCS91688.1 MAG: membrane protein [Metallosphaera javensis (ex Sakai et al. 2022)]
MLRRYLILGAFDGVLLSLGILVSSTLAKASTGVIELTVISGVIAVAISSAWNSLIVEVKERKLEFERLERQMMRSLKGSTYDYGMKITIVLSVLSHGLSPFLGLLSLVVTLVTKTVVYGVVVSLGELFLLGLAYEGSLKEKIRSGLVIALGGAVMLLISFFLGK